MRERRDSKVAVGALWLLLGCGGGPAWQRAPDGPLVVRWGHVAVYDTRRDRMLVFGGQSTSGLLNDVWAMDLATLGWEQLQPTGEGPSRRTNLAAFYDEARDRLVLVDGRVGANSPLSDVWQLDLTANAWTELSSAPPARLDLPIATDGQRAWVFGGVGEPLQSLSDLWEMDLSTNLWRQLPDDGLKPAARGSSAMFYLDGAVYLVGGHDFAVPRRDAWRYTLSAQAWEPLAPDGAPVAAAHFGYAFDTGCPALYLSAGDNLDNYDVALTDALALTPGPRYAPVPASDLPPPRDHSAMIEDARRRLVLYGGGSLGDGLGLLGDTWLLTLGPCP